jgi:hypothetical protein
MHPKQHRILRMGTPKRPGIETSLRSVLKKSTRLVPHIRTGRVSLKAVSRHTIMKVFDGLERLAGMCSHVPNKGE